MIKDEVLDYLDSLGLEYYLTVIDEVLQYSYYPENQSPKTNVLILADAIREETLDIEDNLGIELSTSIIH